MPTYRVGDVDPAASWRPVPQRPLTWEQCGAVLGYVAAVHPHASMTAAAACAVFAAARPLVEQHVAESQGTKQ